MYLVNALLHFICHLQLSKQDQRSIDAIAVVEVVAIVSKDSYDPDPAELTD